MQNYLVKFSPGDLVFWHDQLMEVKVVMLEHFLNDKPAIRYILQPTGNTMGNEVMVFDDTQMEAFGD